MPRVTSYGLHWPFTRKPREKKPATSSRRSSHRQLHDALHHGCQDVVGESPQFVVVAEVGIARRHRDVGEEQAGEDVGDPSHPLSGFARERRRECSWR